MYHHHRSQVQPLTPIDARLRRRRKMDRTPMLSQMARDRSNAHTLHAVRPPRPARPARLCTLRDEPHRAHAHELPSLPAPAPYHLVNLASVSLAYYGRRMRVNHAASLFLSDSSTPRDCPIGTTCLSLNASRDAAQTHQRLAKREKKTGGLHGLGQGILWGTATSNQRATLLNVRLLCHLSSSFARYPCLTNYIC